MLDQADIRVQAADLEQTEHQQAILTLLDAYAQEPHISDRGLADEVRDRLIPELRKQAAGRHFLAFSRTEAVGVAICFLGFSTFSARPLLNVHDLTVRQGWRGNGIGRRLLEAVEDAARELGCCKVTLEVRSDNQARRLYEAAGFRAGDSAETSFAFMTKMLDSDP